MLKKLWNDEAGAIISAELILVATIVVLGSIVGLASLRDAIVTELADVGAAIGSLNQTFQFSNITSQAGSLAGSQFQDAPDFGDAGGSNASNSMCVVIS
ncbi:MAG: hypothetical protein JSS02_25960, partial [Planctomycetes bacterium]|nr:hypothetical protein [Planctomycetota bacterium]